MTSGIAGLRCRHGLGGKRTDFSGVATTAISRTPLIFIFLAALAGCQSAQDNEGRHDAQRGMRQFVVGTGGAKLTPLRLRKFRSEVSDNSTHGVLKLVLRKAGYEWEFLPVDKNGFTDHGMAVCHRAQ